MKLLIRSLNQSPATSYLVRSNVLLGTSVHFFLLNSKSEYLLPSSRFNGLLNGEPKAAGRLSLPQGL